MALTHCKLAVILGTKTYGKKTTSGFSTFEELDYIFEVNKPFFLVKMCAEFEEPETLFRLPSRISYFPWHPASDAERRKLPPNLVDKVIKRLEKFTSHRGGPATLPLPLLSLMLGPQLLALRHMVFLLLQWPVLKRILTSALGCSLYSWANSSQCCANSALSTPTMPRMALQKGR
jgi:hypothetical protein